jgi:hypothetical protein
MTKTDLEKLPAEKLSGEIAIDDLKIECYHLDNNTRVISGRGLQKILGINTRKSGKKLIEASGNTLQNLLISFKKKDNCPDTVYEIEKVFKDEVIQFKRKGAGGSAPYTNGFEATFLMDICHFIQDLYLSGILPEKYNELYDRATQVERAYSKLGIIAHIDEATGYNKEKDEYHKLFKQYILEEAREWEKEFPEELIDIFYKIYGIKKIKGKNHPWFFGKLINKYIYHPLANSNGAILKMLQDKNPVIISKNGTRYRKSRFFQFLKEEIGLPELRKHIWKFIGVGSASVNKSQLERSFARAFPQKGDQIDMFDD